MSSQEKKDFFRPVREEDVSNPLEVEPADLEKIQKLFQEGQVWEVILSLPHLIRRPGLREEVKEFIRRRTSQKNETKT